MTLETVPTDTPACRATSLIPTRDPTLRPPPQQGRDAGPLAPGAERRSPRGFPPSGAILDRRRRKGETPRGAAQRPGGPPAVVRVRPPLALTPTCRDGKPGGRLPRVRTVTEAVPPAGMDAATGTGNALGSAPTTAGGSPA